MGSMESFGKSPGKKKELTAMEKAIKYGRGAIFGVAALAGGYEAGALRASLLSEPSAAELGINLDKWKDVQPAEHIEDRRTKKPHDEKLIAGTLGVMDAVHQTSPGTDGVVDTVPAPRQIDDIDEELRHIGYDKLPPAEPLPSVDSPHMPR